MFLLTMNFCVFIYSLPSWLKRITLLLQCDWTILLPVLNISSNFMDNPYILTMNSTYRLDMDNKDFYMASFPKISDFPSSVDFPHQTMDYAISVIYLVAMGMHLYLSKWFQRGSILRHFSHRVQCEKFTDAKWWQ
jgi:hypothetical protein